MDKERNIQPDVDPEFGDYIIEEGANTSINLRKISWNGRPFKLDLRKYTYKNGAESYMKGITFTDDGAHELTDVLVSKGYGSTKHIMRDLKTRDDFDPAMVDDDYDFSDPDPKESDDDYFDPNQLLASFDENEKQSDSILLNQKPQRRK